MAQSQYIEYINSFMPDIVLGILEKLNGTTNAPSTYLHKTLMGKDYSVDGKWQTIFANYSTVMADYVAMDSSLPLKSRDSQGNASGEISKMGVEMWLNETQLTELDLLVQQGGTQEQIATKIFRDYPRCVIAIAERLEFMTQQGLSTGIATADTENEGTGVRLDYKYPSGNKFGVGFLWSNPASATPIDDLNRMVAKANLDGNIITRLLMDKTAYNNLIKTTQMKELYGAGIAYGGDYTKIPSLTPEQANSVLQARAGIGNIQIIDWVTRYQIKGGDRVTIRPWADGAVVGLATDQVGSVIYSRLAEQSHPVAGVAYNTVDDYILTSQFRKTEPSLMEVTRAQARAVPVIAAVDQIYLLDSKTVQA